MAARSVASVRMNRWVILAGYALLTACTQWLWLAYAPITTQTHQIMGVSEGAVGDLAGIFPLMYVILALPAGRWLDARFGRALSLGAVLTGAGGLLRLAGPSSYGWALAGQFVTAAGQPFVLNSITKVAARYFPARERTVAISIGSVALFAGILAAVLSGGPLLHAGGLTLLLRVQAAVAVVAALWVLAAVRTPAAFPGDPSVAVSLRWLRGDRFMWLLARPAVHRDGRVQRGRDVARLHPHALRARRRERLPDRDHDRGRDRRRRAAAGHRRARVTSGGACWRSRWW